jgi:hypothetical protein
VTPDETELAILARHYPDADPKKPPWEDIKADLLAGGVPTSTVHDATSRDLVRMLDRVRNPSQVNQQSPDSGTPPDRDWRRELPFLLWSQNGEGVILGHRGDGEWGYKCNDGSVIPFNTDPRLAEYEAYAAKRESDYIRKNAVEPMKAAYATITNPDDPESFPQSFILERPEFMAWINGQNPDYRPTIAEYRLLYPAYQERLRKLRERAIQSQFMAMPEQLPADVSERNKLGKKALAALQIIEQEGPIQGKALAKRINVEFSTFRKHIVPPLKAVGVKNDGHGYYVAPCSAHGSASGSSSM